MKSITMITVETFYKGYQIHHHRAKATMLKKLLESNDFIKPEEIVDAIWGFAQEDYDRMLRIEMRANLFHAIDTLFTLFFCLQPNNKGVVNDGELFRNLNKRNFYYENIRKISTGGVESLNVLDAVVLFKEQKLKFGQYLFYYAFKQEKFPPGLEDSIDAIKHAIYLLADEMSDTAEYNAYKHALRSLPAIQEFAFARLDTKEIVMRFDTKNSITYFQELKNNGFSYCTKVFDTERDFKMTLLASNLIYNIVMFRRASIVRDMPVIPLAYFSKENVYKCAERSTDSVQFTNSVKPILNQSKKVSKEKDNE